MNFFRSFTNKPPQPSNTYTNTNTSLKKIGKNNELAKIATQIIGGFVIVYIIYIISKKVMKTDELVISNKYGGDGNIKGKIDIVSGYADSSSITNVRINSAMPTPDNYIPIQPSSNLKGGAQFSYSLWMYIGSPDATINQCLFIKGDPNKYGYDITDNTLNYTKSVVDRVAYCPMINFAANQLEFDVMFNTTNNVQEVLHIKRLVSGSTALRHNVASLFSGKWFLFTVVFEDNIPINDFENGISVRVYINDILYQEGHYAAALKQNNGNLFILPDGASIPNFKISNFAYYNYAIGDDEIKSIYAKGPNMNPSSLVAGAFITPVPISDYNRIDVYNT